MCRVTLSLLILTLLTSLFFARYLAMQQSRLPSAEPRRQLPPAENRRGVHLLLTDTFHDWPIEVWDEHLDWAHEAVGDGGTVLQLVRLDDLDVGRWQHFMDLCAERQLRPILRLATTPNEAIGGWNAPPADWDGHYRSVARQYADFVTALQWPDGPHIVIVANEPNHGNEWGGRVAPDEYARFLIDVASELHRRDPQAIVLNAPLDTFSPHTNGQPLGPGGPLMDAESFMDGMIAAEPNVFSYIDAWGSHPYPLGAFKQSPQAKTFQIDYLNGASNPNHLPVPAHITNRGVAGYEWEQRKLASYGVVDLPILITETGWRFGSADNPDGYPTEETAAAYLSEAWETQWRDDPQVYVVIPFAFDGHPDRWAHSSFVVVDEVGHLQRKTALFDAWKALQP